MRSITVAFPSRQTQARSPPAKAPPEPPLPPNRHISLAYTLALHTKCDCSDIYFLGYSLLFTKGKFIVLPVLPPMDDLLQVMTSCHVPITFVAHALPSSQGRLGQNQSSPYLSQSKVFSCTDLKSSHPSKITCASSAMPTLLHARAANSAK